MTFTADQLTHMRAVLNQLMPDTGYILTLAYTPDGYGGVVETWGTAGTITCRVDPLRGSEILTGGAFQPYHGFQLTASYDTVLTEAHRVKVGAETYAVKSVDGDKSDAISLRATLERL
ncbi:MAG: head-tail adaptor protein [Bellilinea sp.]